MAAAGFNFDPFNPFGSNLSVHVPATDSSWIGRLTFKVHDETLKHATSEGERLIKKVTAYRDDGSEYWTQAFYRSTGSNSKYPGFWFPFLGISLKDGKTFYAKDIPLPLGWPDEDGLEVKQSSELGAVRDDTRELAGRFIARSFLLGANALSALRPERSQRAYIMERLFDSGLLHEKVDPTIAGIIIDNDDYKEFKEQYATLKASSDKELNTYIGKDIYINYGRRSAINLSAFNGLPNYHKNLRGGGRRTRKGSFISRILKKRSTRRAPSEHASELAVGTVKEVGKEIWIVLPAGKSQRWMKATGYFIHDNGGRPFYVQIKSPAQGGIIVREWTAPNIYGKVTLVIPKYERVWIGENKGPFANKYEIEGKGNSILVHVSSRKYISIGFNIIEFKALDTIKEFHGIIGNNDVVYAFAIGTENMYLFMEDVYISKKDVPHNVDPFDIYYDNRSIGKSLPNLRVLRTRLEY